MFRFFKYMGVREWVMMVFLILTLILQVYCDVTLPGYTEEIVEKMQAGASTASILETGGIMLIYAALSVVGSMAGTVLSTTVSTSLGKRIRSEVFSHIVNLSESELRGFSAGSLLTRTTNDVQQILSALILGLRLGIGAPLLAIMAIVKIAQSGYEFTLLTGIGVFILFAGIMTVLILVEPRIRKIQKLTDKLNGTMREHITGIRVIRAYNAEEYQNAKFETVSEDYRRNNIFTGRMTAVINPLIMFVNYGLTLGIYWLGCYLILRDNNPGLFPTMFSYTQLVAQIATAFMVMIMLLQMIPRAIVSAKRVNEVLDRKSSVTDPASPLKLTLKGTERPVIEFENVSYGYENADRDVLHDISFRIMPGETFAVLGATGAGKTTLVKLILRFFDATEGYVRVGGSDVKDLSVRELRGSIGYVPQKNVLFCGTIRENIGFGHPELPEENVREAARIACADGFISEKEGGYESAVAQRGTNFSGGQRQRLCIARAVAGKPEICLFDDSFSALDLATDARVRQNLKESMPGITKVIVTQRAGTVRDADQILVLRDGRAEGLGTHRQLMENCQAYRDIVYSQTDREEEA